MTRRTEMYCALSSIVGIVILLVGIWPIAGLLPVPSPNYSAQQIADFYRTDTVRLRVGLFVVLIGVFSYGPLCVAISRRMRRISLALICF